MSILKVKDGSTWVDIPAIVGPEGEDGYSPTVSVEEIEGGHEVTITDADGPHSFDVMDGSGGDVPEDLTEKVDHLWGNRLIGSMGGTVASVDDAYAAYPKTLDVYGTSTQVTTTGKNLLDPDLSHWVSKPIPDIGSRRSYFIPAEEGVTYHWHRTGDNFYLGSAWCNDTDLTDYSRIAIWTATKSASVTNSSNYAYLLLFTYNSDSADFISRSPIIEKGSTYTSYEPYTGGLPSPRPDWPQPIMSVNGVELHASADGTTDATNWPVTLYDGMLRSLPDGTKDTLELTYLQPSTREGWAVYQATLTALVGMTTTAATDGITGTVGVDVMSTTGEIADGPTVLYKLASAQTTTLDPIELPQLPAPNATVWCDGGSAQPTYSMEYVRDTTIVIQQLEAAIADLATS